MWYAGIDVHWRTSTVCILDENGKQVKMFTVPGGWRELLERLERLGLPQPWAVCYEASCGYGYLHERLVRLAARVVVAHPGALRLIFRAKRKNDRVDAAKLAKLLFLDQVPAVHVPSADVRSWRMLIEYRSRLIDKRTRCKNGLRTLLRSHGIAAGRSPWTGKGRAWLAGLEWPSLPARLQRDLLVAELEQFNQQVTMVTASLDRLARAHPAVGLLRTIPGVGPRTAEAIVAYVDDVRRFARSRQVSAYLGLVPSQDASAGVNRLGHITCNGPSTVRKLLVEASWQVIRRCPAVKARFQRLAGTDKKRRKIALVAVAAWLARCMAAMLRSGETWRQAA